MAHDESKPMTERKDDELSAEQLQTLEDHWIAMEHDPYFPSTREQWLLIAASKTARARQEGREEVQREYSADLHRAHRTCESIAHLLSGAAPWVEHARVKAEEYADYFKKECEKVEAIRALKSGPAESVNCPKCRRPLAKHRHVAEYEGDTCYL